MLSAPPRSFSWSAFSVQATPIEAWPVQAPPLVRLACWLGNRPPLVEAGGWRPVRLLPFSRPGLPHTRGRLRKKKPNARGCHRCLIGGYLPKPPNPRWIVYVLDASRTASPNPSLHPARKRPAAFSAQVNAAAGGNNTW